MISRSQSKYIRSLALQKFRKEHGCYTVEGEKIVAELLNSSLPVLMVVCTEGFHQSYANAIKRLDDKNIFIVSEAELQSISNLQHATQALAVAPIPDNTAPLQLSPWVLALDEVRDPGNMGAILRIADWFGIHTVVASLHAVDFFNPKVVQAAMGAHFRLQLASVEMNDWLSKQSKPIMGATLKGESIYSYTPPSEGILLLGNESKGLREEVLPLCQTCLTIPRMGGAESLNVAVATGILCSHLLHSK